MNLKKITLALNIVSFICIGGCNVNTMPTLSEADNLIEENIQDNQNYTFTPIKGHEAIEVNKTPNIDFVLGYSYLKPDNKKIEDVIGSDLIIKKGYAVPVVVLNKKVITSTLGYNEDFTLKDEKDYLNKFYITKDKKIYYSPTVTFSGAFIGDCIEYNESLKYLNTLSVKKNNEVNTLILNKDNAVHEVLGQAVNKKTGQLYLVVSVYNEENQYAAISTKFKTTQLSPKQTILLAVDDIIHNRYDITFHIINPISTEYIGLKEIDEKKNTISLTYKSSENNYKKEEYSLKFAPYNKLQIHNYTLRLSPKCNGTFERDGITGLQCFFKSVPKYLIDVPATRIWLNFNFNSDVSKEIIRENPFIKMQISNYKKEIKMNDILKNKKNYFRHYFFLWNPIEERPLDLIK